MRTYKIRSGAELSWLYFLSSRLPSLVFAAKISQLLHFVAKISHSHCSSSVPLVSEVVPWFSLICP